MHGSAKYGDSVTTASHTAPESKGVGEFDSLKRAMDAALDARMKGIETALERLPIFAEGFGQPNPLARERPVSTATAPAASLAATSVPVAVPVGVRAGTLPVASDPSLEPILTSVAFTPRTERILLAWAVALREDVGEEGFPEVIAYLESIGWIGRDVRVRLARLGAGIATPAAPHRFEWRLTPQTFERSLACIAELQGMG